MFLTTSIISSSVPEPFSPFTACMTNLQFDCTYPSFGFMRSMLGVLGFGPGPSSPVTNESLETEHTPVQTVRAHASVRSNGRFFFFALARAYTMACRHGVSVRTLWRLLSFSAFQWGRLFAYLSRIEITRFSRCFSYMARAVALTFSGFCCLYLSFLDFHRHCFRQYRERLCLGVNTLPQTSHARSGRLFADGTGYLAGVFSKFHHYTSLFAQGASK